MKIFSKINQPTLYLSILLFVLWFLGSIPLKNTLSLVYKDQSLIASYNYQTFAKLSAPNFKYQNYEIFDLNNNLPQPNLFTSTLISKNIDFINNSFNFNFQNLYYADIRFPQSNTEYYSLHFTPFWDRTLEILHVKDNQIIDKDSNWRSFKFPPIYSFRMILFIITRPIPFVLLWLIVKKYFFKKNKITLSSASDFPWFLNFLFIFFFGYLLLVNIIYVQKIPHSPDSVAYVWASKYLAIGKLWLSPPSDFFNYENQPITMGHWTILWPIGHPLVLAIGSFFNATYIIPPLVGTLTLYLFYKILKFRFSTFISVITTLIFFFSPFFQMHATTFMSHNTAAFFVTLLIYFILKFHSSPSIFFTIISSLALVLLSQIRLYTALILAISLSLVFIYNHFFSKKTFFVFIIFCFSFSILFLFINKFSYGYFLQTPYRLINQSKTIFYNQNITIDNTLTDAVSNLQVLRLIIFPGLPFLFFFLIINSFYNFKYFKLILFCLFNILGIFCINLTFDDPWGLFYGPRFWYEMLPFIFILIAIGLDYISNKKINIIVLVIILYYGIFGWILNKFPLWKNMFYTTPNSISALKSFNYVDDRLIKISQKLTNVKKIIFIKDCNSNWWCYGSVFAQNDVNFNNNLIWAKDLGLEKNQELINLYPSYKIYLADYENSEIIPYDNYQK